MRYCSNCGTQNDPEAKFCSGCGAKLDSAPAAPVEEAAGVAPAPIPVPTDDFAQQAPPAGDFQRAADDFAQQAPQFDQAPQYQQPQFDQAPQYQQPQFDQAPQYQQPQYGGQPQQYGNQGYTPYQQTVAPGEGISAKCRTFGIISFVLGIFSVAFCWLAVFLIWPVIFPLAAGIIGLIFSGISRRAGTFTLARLGKIFSIIGICLCGFVLILVIILAASGAIYFY